MATTLKELARIRGNDHYYLQAQNHFSKALYQFEAIGNHTNTAATENNFGFMLLNLGRFKECEPYLRNSLELFSNFGDHVRCAQVNETLTHLYLASDDLPKAERSIDIAVTILEESEDDAVLAEALITKGRVAAKQFRNGEAKNCFESAYRVAERLGDADGSTQALLSLLDELGRELTTLEIFELKTRLRRGLSKVRHPGLAIRIEEAIAKYHG